MGWYETNGSDYPSIFVQEAAKERPTQVLDMHGNPYYLERAVKMGFDLTPRNKKGVSDQSRSNTP